MAMLFVVLGFGWAAIGGVNLILMYGKGADLAGLAGLGWAINGCLFLLPGVMVGVLGWHLRNQRERDQQRIQAEPERHP